MALFNLFSKRLRRIGTLQGHQSAVVAMAVSPKGHYLASGGVEGLKIWDIRSRTEVPLPMQSYNEKIQVSCLCWVSGKNDLQEALCYGNAYGFLVLLRYSTVKSKFEAVHSGRTGQGGELLHIASYHSPRENITRVTLSGRDKGIQVWSFEPISGNFKPLYAKVFGPDKDIIPKAVFLDNNVEQDLMVFGLYDGGLHIYRGANMESIAKHQFGSQIGNVAVDLDRRICVVDNVAGGFDAYQLDSGNFLRSFKARDPIKSYPRSVVFGNNYDSVVGGSDHGLLYIFDVHTGKIHRKIRHCKNGGAEIVAVHDNDDGTVLIASASSTTTDPCPILLWRWRPTREDKDGRTWGKTIKIWMRLLLVLAVGMQVYILVIWMRQKPDFKHAQVPQKQRAERWKLWGKGVEL